MRQAGNRVARAILIAVLICADVSLAAGQGVVARITDLEGQATMAGAGDKNLRILGRVSPGAEISLSADARITLHFPASRTDYRFVGPNTINVSADAASGSDSPATIHHHGDIGITLDAGDSDLGAIAMRGLEVEPTKLEMLRPVDTTILLTRPIRFQWQVTAPFDEYQFSLENANGVQLYSRFTGDAGLDLPAEVTLSAGNHYRWSVTASAVDGRSAGATAEFTTASTADEARFFRLAALNRGDVSNRVLYTLYLDALGLHLEAEAARQALEPVRPGISSRTEPVR